MEDNCLNCLYANYSDFTLMFQEISGEEHRKCEHPNSAYQGEIVSEDTVCRLFVDEKEYFRNKDLREKIIHLKNKNK